VTRLAPGARVRARRCVAAGDGRPPSVVARGHAGTLGTVTDVASWPAAVRAVRQLPCLDEVTAMLSIAAESGLSAADVADELRVGA
jgi:hypothetical protein